MIEDLGIQCSEGNPGALGCYIAILQTGNPMSLIALQRMRDSGITGEKLYLLWNDCCDRDTEKTLRVMLEKTKDEILDHIDYRKHDYRCVPFEFEETE